MQLCNVHWGFVATALHIEIQSAGEPAGAGLLVEFVSNALEQLKVCHQFSMPPESLQSLIEQLYGGL